MDKIIIASLAVIVIVVMIKFIVLLLRYFMIISGKHLTNQAIQIVHDTVDEVSQTYVEELKNKNQFDSSAQKEALQIAVDKSTTMMSSKVKDYISNNYDDLTKWIITQVESYIWNNKNVSEDKSQVPIKLNG